MGHDLDGRWFDVTRLRGWSLNASRLGLRYDMPAELVSALPTALIGPRYQVRSGDVNEEGWHVNDPVIDRQKPGFESRDPVGVRLRKREPQIACLGDDVVLPELPSGRELTGKVLVVSPGNERLVSIEMDAEGQVQILPYTFVRPPSVSDGRGWPYGNKDTFARQISNLGAALVAAPSDDDLLRTWCASARELGVRAFESAGPVELMEGFALVPSADGRDGWLVLRSAGSAGAPGGSSPSTFLATHEPSIWFVTPEGCTTQPPEAGLNGSVVLVAPGNGRLVVIEMKRDGLVSILPQAFD